MNAMRTLTQTTNWFIRIFITDAWTHRHEDLTRRTRERTPGGGFCVNASYITPNIAQPGSVVWTPVFAAPLPPHFPPFPQDHTNGCAATESLEYTATTNALQAPSSILNSPASCGSYMMVKPE